MKVTYINTDHALRTGAPTPREQHIIAELTRGNGFEATFLLDEYLREHPQRVVAVHAYLYIVPGLMSRYQDLITEHVNNLPVRTLLADPMSGSSQNESPPPYEDIVGQESKVLTGKPVLDKSKTALEAPSSESQVVKDAKKENLDNPNVLRKRKRS